MASRSFQFLRECVHKFGVGRGTGVFIYALFADETSPALAALRHCFPAASNVLVLSCGNRIFAATPTGRITDRAYQMWERMPQWIL